MYNDYTKAVNLAHDWIRWPCIRVSTARIPSFADNMPFGFWFETWIFSNCPHIRTKQIAKKQAEKAIQAHRHIVNNLKSLLKEKTNG